MSFTAVTARPGGAAASPREWWQVWAERRARWMDEHPGAARRVRRVRTVLAWLMPVYLLVVVVVMPDVRAGMRVWLGTLWVVVAWFFVARTKTLTWSGYMRFLSACVVWSMAVGATLRTVSADLGGMAGLGQGAVTFVAGISEEALKVAPVVLLAVLAPRRVSRFAAVDFVLLGLVSGAAFEAVEEAVRRTHWVTNDNKGLVALLYDVDSNGIPVDYVHYGLWPIPTELTGTAAWTGDPVTFAGHAMTTALVCGAAGLGVVAWRAVRTRSSLARVVVRPVGLVVPVVALVTMMSDHLACNARLHTGDAWLADGSAVPWWLQVPWQWFGQAQYRPAGFVLLFVVCLAVDAFRLAARPATSLVPGPAWAWVARAGAGLAAWHARSRWPGRALAASLNAALALVWITGRDLGQTVLAHTRDPGETRLTAARRAATAVSAQRTAREAGMEHHHAGPVHPWCLRLVAIGLLAGLLVAALVLAPHLAEGTGPNMRDGWSWLAGLLDAITRWWDSLTPGQKIVVAVAVGFVVAAVPGLSFGAAFWIAGVATWGLEHHAGIKTFARDPAKATGDYFANATPGQLALDGLDLVLTAIPVGVGATTGRATRQATREFIDNPAVFRAQRRAMMDDTGASSVEFFLNLQRQGPALSTPEFATFSSSQVRMYESLSQRIPDLKPRFDGSAFNWQNYSRYDVMELRVTRPDGGPLRALDSADLGGDLVSRKGTQLAEVSVGRARDVVNEVPRNYKPGADKITIADTQLNRLQLERFGYEDIIGRPLEGRMVLEVPVQNLQVPQEIIELATRQNVIIRDVLGHVYTLRGGTP
ncbi:MAG: hypothetical protein FWH11_11220 [Micrococcales bacterium]|nr:hypothetical protein [Micrococcales bacterium]